MPETDGELRTRALQVLQQLGAELGFRRRRHRIPIATLAARALTTRQTVARIEKGDPGVAVGTWAAVLTALELSERLRDLAQPGQTPGRLRMGFDVQDRLLPKRVRKRKYEH